MKRVVLFLFVFAFIASHLPLQAQTESCLPIRFFGGQEVRVIGSADAGGLPFRSEPGLSEAVEGFIPLDTVLVSDQMLRCVEGRNWYTLLYALSEDEGPSEVWVTDGDGHAYWLEPAPICSSASGGVRIHPSSPSYPQDLNVDSFDESTNTLRFSAVYWEDANTQWETHYFNLDMTTGVVTQTDYWYRDLITRELTDQLGITERVFGENGGFGSIYVSPDQTKILYRVPNPPREDCAHGCYTDSLWIADIDGSNQIPLMTIYGSITRIIWEEDGTIYLSKSHLEVYEANAGLILCADGSCAGDVDDLILAERSLPFEYSHDMPMVSPNGEWMALMMGSEALLSQGTPMTGFILNREDNRYIQLPYNGNPASEIVWVDDDTILYPVLGIGWDGEDYGLPSDFYQRDVLWEINLDFEALTYSVDGGGGRTYWEGYASYEGMLHSQQTHHVLLAGGRPLVYSDHSLAIYCVTRG